jgi:hypothetical protein
MKIYAEHGFLFKSFMTLLIEDYTHSLKDKVHPHRRTLSVLMIILNNCAELRRELQGDFPQRAVLRKQQLL